MLLSAVILTRNESGNIERCIDNLQFCDEILVIDDNSSDNTAQLAEKADKKVKVFKRALGGDFSAQRNFALGKASGDWILFVDADEVVGIKLKEEILKKISSDAGAKGYFLKRRDIFWGRELYFGETGNIKLLRLGQKGAGIWIRPVHEFWEINGRTETLSEALKHYPHPTIGEFLESINRYTETDARELPKEGKKFSYFSLLANPKGKFLLNYILRLGFLDGKAGLAVAFMMSLHSLITRVKMYDFARPQ